MSKFSNRCRHPRGFVAAWAAALGLTVAGGPAHAAVAYEMVTIGNPGNAADTTGYGAVNSTYQIGKYEVTIGQYCEFLDAVAKSDPYSLWNLSMETDLSIAGIARTGTSGAYSYTVSGPSGMTPAAADSPGNRPITYVSCFDAARFANWMHNGQPTHHVRPIVGRGSLRRTEETRACRGCMKVL